MKIFVVNLRCLVLVDKISSWSPGDRLLVDHDDSGLKTTAQSRYKQHGKFIVLVLQFLVSERMVIKMQFVCCITQRTKAAVGNGHKSHKIPQLNHLGT